MGLVVVATMPLLLVWPFTEAGRFLVPLVPMLLVGAVEGLAPTFLAIGRRRPRAWAAGAVLLAGLPYAVYAPISGRAEAERRGHAAFDAACAWIAREGRKPGPILTRHPGEAAWQTGRTALAPPGDDPEGIDRLVRRHGVAYLLIDRERYADAPASPLERYARARPGRWVRAWDEGKATVYEVEGGGGPE